jgi:hypothetical protein
MGEKQAMRDIQDQSEGKSIRFETLLQRTEVIIIRLALLLLLIIGLARVIRGELGF